MSLGTAGLVFSAGAGQTTVPVTPAEASAYAAELGSVLGGNGVGFRGAVNGSASGGPVVFTGGACGWISGRDGIRMGGVVILIGLKMFLLGW